MEQVDIPYGFRISGSTYDNVPYKYPQIEKMVKDFVESADPSTIMAYCYISQYGSSVIGYDCIEVEMPCPNICIGKHSVTIYLICGIYVAYDIFINLFSNNCAIGFKQT